MTTALLTIALLAQTWEQQIVSGINALRDQANQTEQRDYGYVRAYRYPLVVNPTLTYSAQWWCNALEGTGFDYPPHGWYVSRSGFIVASPTSTKPLSRVWLPQDNGWSSFVERNWYLNLRNPCSENGVTLNAKDAIPANVVEAWRRSGWNDDPLKATEHYWNCVNPNWTDVGVASGRWKNGARSIYGEFMWRMP
jgi:hypothetical protein